MSHMFSLSSLHRPLAHGYGQNKVKKGKEPKQYSTIDISIHLRGVLPSQNFSETLYKNKRVCYLLQMLELAESQ